MAKPDKPKAQGEIASNRQAGAVDPELKIPPQSVGTSIHMPNKQIIKDEAAQQSPLTECKMSSSPRTPTTQSAPKSSNPTMVKSTPESKPMKLNRNKAILLLRISEYTGEILFVLFVVLAIRAFATSQGFVPWIPPTLAALGVFVTAHLAVAKLRDDSRT